MLENLMALYHVEGNHKKIVGGVISCIRDAVQSGALLFTETLKVLPLIGWLLGGLGSAAVLEAQTTDLGRTFLNVLDDLYKKQKRITTDDVMSELRRRY
jgi:uncharacterized protein (DUF697 family)